MAKLSTAEAVEPLFALGAENPEWVAYCLATNGQEQESFVRVRRVSLSTRVSCRLTYEMSM